jgi:hypothetical protein
MILLCSLTYAFPIGKDLAKMPPIRQKGNVFINDPSFGVELWAKILLVVEIQTA